jgi:hypothetical protein
MVPAGMRPQIDVTLTDEEPIAEAFVVISAIPLPAETDPLSPDPRGKT